MSIPFYSAIARHALWSIPIISAVIAGCSSNPPIAAISSADMAVNQAMSAKASEYAPADLQRALDKSARAKQAMGDENYRRARRLAEEAQVDAQAAEARAKSEEAKRTTDEAQRTMDSLRRQTQERGSTESETPSGGTGHGYP
ncbi:DUF4398 domain-containing protein [Methylomagnum sp.]